MAQLERPQSQRQVETSKSPPTIHTMEQLLRAGEASKSKNSPTYASPVSSASSNSPSSSPFFQRLRSQPSSHDSEEDHGQTQKKSVLTKVKEKAKKLRHSLSKRRQEDGNTLSPTSPAGLESYGVEDQDVEYLGAPMYESEKAPTGYKENTKLQPRGNPVISEKQHVSTSKDKHVLEQEQEKSLSRSLSKKTTQPAKPTLSPTDNISNTISSPNKTMNKTVTEKVTPVCAEGSVAGHTLTSKIQGLTVSKPTEQHHHHHRDHQHQFHPSSSTAISATSLNKPPSLSIVAPLTPPAKAPSQTGFSPPQTSSPAPSSAPPLGRKNTSSTAQIWDKGVSVKEYLMNKLEPGEDEKALSKVISEAMSPRRTPGDAGVMEKVREAVTSLLRNDEPQKYADTTTTPPVTPPARTAVATTPPSTPSAPNVAATTATATPTPVATTNANAATTTRMSSQTLSSTNAPQPLSPLPVSTNPREVTDQEENHGRILQAN
ncbi:hypothetical protein RJT34_30065 [Clitoria ternatea]|uniref:LTI65/LTI78 PGEED repeat domain-containing protein n=1 Tax=Clitoria ternatea TaxID=43366 RepID=A0AAN9ESE4_CLITE